MKNTKHLLICMILIILGIIMTIIALAMSTVVNKDTIKEKNKEKIIENYTQLTIVSGNNVDLRNELADKLRTFSNETYHAEHESFITLINKYEENIKSIETYTKNIDSKCDKDYEDSRIDVICKGYKMLYEETTNIYIANLTDYNDKIKKYNEIATTSYNEIKMLKNEYIDYDNDRNYLGKPTEKE